MKSISLNPILLILGLSLTIFVIFGYVKPFEIATEVIDKPITIPKVKTRDKSHPVKLFRGCAIDKYSEQGILKPYGMKMNGKLKNNCNTDPIDHVHGNNFSNMSSFTESFINAFNWSHYDKFKDVQDGLILIADENTIPNALIFNTMLKLGDPYSEREIIIKGLMCGFKTFYTYKSDTPNSALQRARQLGII